MPEPLAVRMNSASLELALAMKLRGLEVLGPREDWLPDRGDMGGELA
jgi:hypothetical protein